MSAYVCALYCQNNIAKEEEFQRKRKSFVAVSLAEIIMLTTESAVLGARS